VLGILPFVRINVGIASMGIAALGGLLALMKAGKRGRSLLAWAAVGTVLSVGLIVMVLGLTGSLSAYIDQAVLFPLSWAGSSSTSGTSAGFLLVFLEQLLPSVVLVGALLLQWGRRSGRAFTELTDRQAATATVVAGILVVVWVARVLVVSIDMPLARWMSDRFVHTSLVGRWSGFLYVFLELSAIVCVALVARFVVAWRGRRAQVLRSTGWLLLAGFGFAGMTQVLPISDPRHVWWALPMGLLALFSAVATITHLPSPSSNPLLIPLAAATVVSLVSAIAYIGNERVPAPAGSVARGMLVPDAVAAGLSSDLATLAPFLEGGGSGIFLTEDGDLSVMEESYTSADPYFVGWGPVPDLSSRVSQRPFIVLTRGYGDDVWESAVQRLPGYRLAAENDRMRVFVADGIRPATENP
jgi:hypothetical protein